MAVLRAIMTTRVEEKEASGSGGNRTATLIKEAEAEARNTTESEWQKCSTDSQTHGDSTT